MGWVILPADGETPEVVKPGEEALDLPTAAAGAQRAAILSWCLFPVPHHAVGSDQFKAAPLQWRSVEFFAVTGFVADHWAGSLLDKAAVERFFHQGHFMRRGNFNAYGDWKTSGFRNGHVPGALAGFGWPNEKPLFFAAMKEPLMKGSVNSRPLRSLRVLARASRLRSRVWSCPRSPYRRWHVGGGAYCSGSPSRERRFAVSTRPHPTPPGGRTAACPCVRARKKSCRLTPP